MPFLQLDSRGPDYIYSLDWTVGAIATTVSAIALVGAIAWARRPTAASRRAAIRAAVLVLAAVPLAPAGVLAFRVAESRFFAWMFGRRSNDVIEHFGLPVTLQVWIGVVAGLTVAVLGWRTAKRGLDARAVVQYAGLVGVVTGALGYTLWLGPERGLAVQSLNHPLVGLIDRRYAWIHDSSADVPGATVTSRWQLVEARAHRSEGRLQIEVHAGRGPLSSLRTFSIALVRERGDEHLPLAVGRQWRFREVELSSASSDVPAGQLEVVPNGEELVIDVLADSWSSGRHSFVVRRRFGAHSETLTVHASGGAWWTLVPGRLRMLSLVTRWLGDCEGLASPRAPLEFGGPCLCRPASFRPPRRGMQLFAVASEAGHDVAAPVTCGGPR